MDAFDSIPSGILQALAWIFTALAGVASISLTILKFGLSPWKRVMLIVGTIGFGLVVVLLVVPMAYNEDASDKPATSGGMAVAGVDKEFLQALIASGTVSGMMIRDDGSMELVFATEKVQGSADDLVAVDLPENARAQGDVDTVLALSGSTVQAQVGAESLGVSVDDDNVIVSLGNEMEFLDRKNLGEAKDFKVSNVKDTK